MEKALPGLAAHGSRPRRTFVRNLGPPARRAAAFVMPAINGGLDLAARLAARRHPALFERLAAVPDPTFALLPRELPIAVIVRADTRRPKIRIIPAEKLDPTRVAATIRGPLRLLAALADGSQDGDALFFSRRIAIEGDTEAAVALRNALDNADLSGLAELVLPPGPAARTAQRLLRMGGRFLEIMHDRAGRTPPGAGSSP